MNTYQQTLTAGQSWKFGVVGGHFRVLTLSTPVDITLFHDGQPIFKALGVMDGFWSSPKGGFNAVQIDSAGAQTVKIGISNGESGYDRYSGSVQVIGQSGAFTQGAVTVSNTASNIVAANAARRYLLIQNNHATDTIYVNFAATATTANGVKIPPGGNMELNGNYMPSGAVSAIGGIASNAEVIVVGG